MTRLPPRLRLAFWFTFAAALAGGLSLAALRVVRSMRRGRGAAFSLAKPVARPLSKARSRAKREPQNVLWVVFEDFPVPASRVAAHEDFPGLDLFAREGVEFQRVYTNRTEAEGGLRCLLTGRLLDEPGGPRAETVKESRPLPALFRGAGYRTLLFGAPGGDPGVWAGLGFETVRPAPPAGGGGESALREAAGWLAAQEGDSGLHFLVVFVRAPADVEDPSPRCWLRAARLSPLAPFQGRRWRALAQAVQMDGALERLWAQVVRLGQDERTLVTVTSLRGSSFRAEPLRRRGDGRAFLRAPDAPGWGLREEEVRVLWLMRSSRLGFGRKVTAPAQLLDAAPTVLDLAGFPPEKEMEGMSFAEKDARNLRADRGGRFLIEGAGGDALVLDGHYKYVRRARPREVSTDGGPAPVARTDFEPEELYDLWMDPGERRNLARRRRDLLARARRAINERRPERTAVRLVLRGFTDPPVQGVVVCPGGDLWNVSLSTGALVRSGSNQVSFTAAAPEAVFSFETWPPPASYTLSLRAGRTVPAEAFIVSRLGLPLVEAEKRTDWFDGNKFPWMEGVPPAPSAGAGPDGPRVLMGREPVPEGAP